MSSYTYILDYFQTSIRYNMYFCIFFTYTFFVSLLSLIFNFPRLLEVLRPIKLASPILMDLIRFLTTWNSLERSTALWLATGKM